MEATIAQSTTNGAPAGVEGHVDVPSYDTERHGFGMGWLPGLPDIRDYTPEHEAVAPLLEAVGVPNTTPPSSVDLRPWCSPVENQGQLGSCTANAGVGMVEYFERRAFNRHLDGSRLFLYKATRDLMGATGDTGAYLRSTMGALSLFGVAPESYWPYNVAKFDVEPPAFVYALGQSFQAVTYYRLDPHGTSAPDVLTRVKQHLASGLPSMFGFTVYSSYSQAATTGKIPFPAANEKVVGGHAIMAVRNSWGTGWGARGYGWLPYEYVLKGLAVDWWVLLKSEWLDTQRFAV
jgi:C1A family cysteine protease